MKRRNSISGQWSPRLIEMLESPAYRALSSSAHMVISRIEIELGHHGGNDNGRLPVTVDQFVEYGMHRTSVAPAIREAEALGFIHVTERGRGGNAEHRSPNRFFLTFAHGRDSRAHPPSHDWRRIKGLEEAHQIARNARANKDQRAVEHGKRSWRQRKHKRNDVSVRKNRTEKTVAEKTEASTESSHVSVRKICTETAAVPVRKNRTTGSGEKTELPLYLGQGDRSEARTGLDSGAHIPADKKI
jgi:hypothetical protein